MLCSRSDVVTSVQFTLLSMNMLCKVKLLMGSSLSWILIVFFTFCDDILLQNLKCVKRLENVKICRLEHVNLNRD